MSDLPEKLRLGGRWGNKKCSRCGIWKPISEFYKERNRGRSGLCYLCKACVKLRNAERYK